MSAQDQKFAPPRKVFFSKYFYRTLFVSEIVLIDEDIDLTQPSERFNSGFFLILVHRFLKTVLEPDILAQGKYLKQNPKKKKPSSIGTNPW